uniref:Uncharacterized protein n=1 Tax=Arundo donax TaxID=35708 RepID=A0A0A9BZU4_ARUDO
MIPIAQIESKESNKTMKIRPTVQLGTF